MSVAWVAEEVQPHH